MKNICKEDKICNKDTNRCVKFNGKIGIEVIKNNNKNINIKKLKSISNYVWEIKEELGKGRLGIVYEACLGKDCNVVLKVQTDLYEFESEIKYMLLLQDTNITPLIYDAWIYNNIGYYIIDKLNKKSRLTNKTIRKKVLESLKKLHERKIVFVDIHDGNVMYKGNNIYLIDFGFSITFENNNELYKVYWSKYPINYKTAVYFDNLAVDLYWGSKKQKEFAKSEFNKIKNELYLFK